MNKSEKIQSPEHDSPGLRRCLARFLVPSFYAALCFGLVPLPSGWAQEAVTEPLTERVRQIFAERAGAVARVEAKDRHGELCGTGFFIDPAGTLLTLYSTVADASEIYVTVGGERMEARVLISDPRSGVALLKVDRATPFIPLASTKTLRLAAPVVAIGYPHDLRSSPSFGIIAGFDRKFRGQFFVTTHLRANIPVLGGFGGAPLLNLDGAVVGMVVAGIDRGAACFALPIDAADKVRRDFARFGEVRHGWVGVTVEGVQGGEVRVARLNPETPASESGIREGDTLLKVGEIDVREVEDVLDASFFLTDGDPVEIVVQREGQKIVFSVQPSAHPASEKDGLHASKNFPGFSLEAP